jgi:hypothetical protein
VIPAPPPCGYARSAATAILEQMDDQVIFEYEHCPLRDRAHGVARVLPFVRPLAGLVWPAARRADRVQLSEDGILARSLRGYARIGWEEVGAVHRSRTTWGRMTVHVVAANPARQIEITESMPGFDDLVATILRNAGQGEIVHLRAA